MEMEAWNIAHRNVCHLFYIKLGDNTTKTLGKLQQALGGDAMSRAQTFRRNKMFFESKNP
jgi:hypothetical protein